MKRALTVIGILFEIVLILLLAALFYYFGVTAGVELDAKKLLLETECIRLFDAEGRETDAVSRDADIPFSEFPKWLPDAFVAVEDKRFYTHGGFDARRIAKAAWKNLTSLSFREGASTISQQLIKNTHLSNEKTLKRKLREFKLTRILERNYSKQQILELYLNSIYFGHSAFGIGGAASFYFGKETKDLSAAECATLAALVRSPNRYSPFRDPEKCLQRRNFVLRLMEEQGYLDERERAEAEAEPLPAAPSVKQRGNAYFSLALEELAALFPDVRSQDMGALRVFTAYDPALQAELESCKAESDLSILVRNKSNALRAFHTTAGLFPRLPASTIKPLLVYGPALEEDLVSPATPVLDERTDFGGYSPNDAGGASGKYISVREAVSRSVNIPAVKILNALGIERGASYLEKMGMKIDRADYSLALALGGMREGFTLKELADGYATFANGSYAPSGAIVRVEDAAGRTLYRRAEGGAKVFSDETRFLMNDMLKTAAEDGTAKKLRSLPFEVCAKTGTAEGGAGNTDAYTIAYTREDVVAVWLGNDDNAPVAASGGGLPANFAKKILERLYEKGAPAPFSPPAGVERVRYDRASLENDHRLVQADPLAPPIAVIEEFCKKTAMPQERSTVFSSPTIKMPQISVKNGCVTIVLCQTEYYDYVVKRKNRDEIITIYSGKYRQTICDNSVRAGESYVYFVTPVYRGGEGKTLELPRIQIEASPPPDDWWENA